MCRLDNSVKKNNAQEYVLLNAEPIAGLFTELFIYHAFLVHFLTTHAVYSTFLFI